MSVVRCEAQSVITFKNNLANFSGGAVHSTENSDIFLMHYSTVLFYNNSARLGDSIYTNYNSHVSITSNSTVRFNNNTTRWFGGVPYSNKYGYADVTFDSNGTITCSDQQTLPVCIHQNCFCKSIDYVLASLTNDTQINLSVNVTLSSIINLSGHVNISIIGHHNPTINCTGGGLKFNYCKNCTIEGITWNGCGAEYLNGSVIPVIEFYNSINITIQNCTFKHSVGQAVTLVEVSGIIEINHCSFLHNKHYEGHGIAVYFSSSNNLRNKHIRIMFTISNSMFTKNKGTRSIVYIGHFSVSNKCQPVLLISCTFSDNKGIPLYLSNQNLQLLEHIIIENNQAKDGAGIFVSDHSTIIFGENSVVTFNQNTANNSGGAIFVNHFSSAIFEANCFVVFNNNTANHYGGSIVSYNNSNVVLKGNSSVQFNSNMAKLGGALYAEANSAFTITQRSSVILNSNRAESGGAVYLINNSSVLLKLKHLTEFQYDNALFYNSYRSLNKSMGAVFIYNSAIHGGAISIQNNSIIQFEETSLVVFIHNEAKGKGGAISCHANSNMLFKEKSFTIFTEHKAELGGTLYLEDNSATIFKGIP